MYGLGDRGSTQSAAGRRGEGGRCWSAVSGRLQGVDSGMFVDLSVVVESRWGTGLAKYLARGAIGKVHIGKSSLRDVLVTEEYEGVVEQC